MQLNPRFNRRGENRAPKGCRGPYLPLPQQTAPFERGQAGFRVPHGAYEQTVQPHRHVSEERTFRSYGEWWQAHQTGPPKEMPAPVRHPSLASSYWPYGKGVTALVGSLAENSGHEYILDNRVLDCVVPHRPQDTLAAKDRVGRRAGRVAIRASGSAAPSHTSSIASSRSSPTLQRAGSVTASALAGTGGIRQPPLQGLLGSHAETRKAASAMIQA